MQFIFVDTKGKLQAAIEKLKTEKIIAVDIECENNLHHYGVYISLIQISSKHENFIFDLLALKNIEPLLELLTNPNIQKIIHDVSFDLRIINHQYNCPVKNIFDTQLVALLLGKEKVGLGSLLEGYFSIKSQKKFQRVDWTKRPLSKGMLSYAAADTAYLLELKEKLEEELKTKGRLEWAQQECKAFEKVDYSYHEQTYLDLPGAKSMSNQSRAILHALFNERKKLAEIADRPVFMIFRNKQLLSFALNPPHNIASWQKFKGVHPLVRKKAPELFEAVEKAKQSGGEEYIQEKKGLTNVQKRKVKELIEIRNKISDRLGIQGYLVMSNEQAREIAVNGNLEGLRQWQRKLIGNKITKD